MISTRVTACLALSALALLTSPASSTLEGPTGRGQDLVNCDIDIRPAPPVGRGEAQVYWGEAGGGKAGARAEIHLGMDGVLLFGTGDAAYELPLKAMKKNVVSWWWDDAAKVLKFRLENEVDTPIEIETTDYTGSFDRLGTLKEPSWEYVRRGLKDRQRMRITLRNFGIDAAFTLSDA